MFGNKAWLALVLALAFAPVAKAQDLVFTLSNHSSVTIVELYVSPTNSDYWGTDLLYGDVIYPGESGDVEIADGLTTCSYDILGVFADGVEVEDYGIDLCALGSYAFTD